MTVPAGRQVWHLEPAELSGPVVFRWYRSVSTDLRPVTLTLRHPFTAVQLHWSPLRAAFESRPVLLPCGRYSGSLRVNGADRPLAPFRVTRFTFEVLLFLSSDVDDRWAEDEPDLPRYIPCLGSHVPSRLRAAAAAVAGEAALDWPSSPTTAALERQHRQLVTRLAGAALLGELAADVRQLRRQSCVIGRQVEELAHELRQERLQRRLREAVRREVARLQADSPRRRREPAEGGAGRRVGRRRRRPASAGPGAQRRRSTDKERGGGPASPPGNTAAADTVRHHVTFDETATAEEFKDSPHELETTEVERDFVFEDLCREERAETELEAKKAGLQQADEELIQGSVFGTNFNSPSSITPELAACFALLLW